MSDSPPPSDLDAPLPVSLQIRLSVMMFFQYAIWGAWLPLFFAFLTSYRGFTASQAGNLFGISAIGALIAPFLFGQIADRYLATEKVLGICHLLGAVMIWQLAELTEFWQLLVFGLLYSIIYAPTLSLTNSLSFYHLSNRDRDFGKIRVWGTLGWIAVGIGMGQFLYRYYTPGGGAEEVAAEVVAATQAEGMAYAFKLSAVLGAILGIYCFTLPNTPPQPSESSFAAGKAARAVSVNPLLTLFLVAFPISCIHQFYFVRTVDFLQFRQINAPIMDAIFGVGGGPMTIGQISEILVLAVMPFILPRVSRKSLLAVGLFAYVLRFAIFAYVDHWLVVAAALALHGICFGCFFFVAFLVVDEESGTDVRASAQSLFNLVVVGIGVIVGNFAAGQIGSIAQDEAGNTNYTTLFAIPMWLAIACLVAFLVFYPSKSPSRPGGPELSE